mmetsp:Transcript_21335/g.29348  ORF Transcript_21335/g.29348 Transcript_21335/m.29348 type:complete len:159 (+) Transcript_21335:59-535(+)
MSLLSSTLWFDAFEKAALIESEGAKDFEELVDSNKRGFKHLYPISHENESPKFKKSQGAFCQPAALANFMAASTKFDLGSEADIVVNEKNECQKLPQICRRWLKYNFLNIGTCCDPNVCNRQHEIIGKPERLYSDYSFKGLNSKQQKIILERVKAEQV